MARSLIQRRQEAERARAEAHAASLRSISQPSRPPPDFQNAIDEAKRGFDNYVLRDPLAWKPQMKTRDPARLCLAAARYLFARYPVAEHLERIWIDSAGLNADEIAKRRRWYVIAAGGRSLYKEGAGAWLTRKEVHAFLNPPGRVGFEAAFWHAIARSYTTDAGLALRIAHSRIAESPRDEVRFWRQVARFFVAYPTTGEEIGDFCDYLASCYHRDPAYSLDGRTLASLSRQMRDWHRDLEAIQRIEAARARVEAARARAEGRAAAPVPPNGGRWTGARIADWSWQTSAKVGGKREQFVIVQLRAADELVAETRAMRHCVASYAAKCIAGHASIWSLRRGGQRNTDRLLTIEVDCRLRAVQIRGFANRLAHAEERKILERWAKARGIELP